MDIFNQDYLTDAIKLRLERVGGLQGLDSFRTVGEAVNPEGHAKRLQIRQQQQREADQAATHRALAEAQRQSLLDTHSPGISAADHDHSECIRRMRAASLRARTRL